MRINTGFTITTICFIALTLPLKSQAQFEISATAALTFKSGKQQEVEYGFKFFRQEGQHFFVAGEQKLVVPSVPQKYSLALVLQNNTDVWMPDFGKTPVQQFSWSIAGHDIALRQDENLTDAPGHFVLTLNNESFYFSRGPGQINFYFSEEGISKVKIEGMLKPRKAP